MNERSSTNTSNLTDEFGQRWNRFWFTPADPLPACVMRIVVGALAAAHFFDLSRGLSQFYASDGILPPTAVRRLLELTSGESNFHYSYLNGIPASTELWAIHFLAIAFSLAFAIGLFTRVAGVLTLVAVLAYVHRVPQVAGHIEPVLSFLIGYLCIAPSGACLSLDRRLFGSAKKTSPMRMLSGSSEPSVAANVGLRLIQVHLAMFYVMMGLTKLYGDAWWDGSGVWILLAQTQSRPLDLTGIRRFGAIGEYALNFWTHTIVYFELAFGILIWTRIGRPILLSLSILVWLSLTIATGHLLFGLTMLTAGFAFLPADFLRVFSRQPENTTVALAPTASA
jgi:uncharacterized membrane protein YphA (DoxX/SURF4 family)